MLVSIDPGTKAAGIAVWITKKNNLLRLAFLARGKTWQETTENAIERLSDEMLWPDSVVIELPEIYMPKFSKGNPNTSLTPLILQAGAFIASFGIGTKHTTIYPKSWKGQTPKPIMVKRIQERLTEEERKHVELPRAQSLGHNVWDAVGIGLHHLGRKTRRKNTRRVEAVGQ